MYPPSPQPPLDPAFCTVDATPPGAATSTPESDGSAECVVSPFSKALPPAVIVVPAIEYALPSAGAGERVELRVPTPSTARKPLVCRALVVEPIVIAEPGCNVWPKIT